MPDASDALERMEGEGSMPEMISLEDARAIVLDHVGLMPCETVPVLESVGRVVSSDIASDIDVAPFPHSAMDGFAVRCADLEQATASDPVILDVIAEEAAGELYDGPLASGQCVRIMTGAPLPAQADSVVKYEIVETVSGDGKTGSRVSFRASTSCRSNVREAGEEAKAGETIVRAGEVVGSAGVGFLASCGAVEVPTYARPRVAIIATGSELVPPTERPAPGKIRNSNSYALAACVQQAGSVPDIRPIVCDTFEALCSAVRDAAADHDFVITTGGAANGDFDFIKPVVQDLGDLLITTVNMRPGKAQTFGVVSGVPVFGLPGNPAAAYVGFHMLIRPALRKMQGYSAFEHAKVVARLSRDVKKRDPRRFYMRATLTKNEQGEYVVLPAENQSSGLFGVIQHSNCMAILPEGAHGRTAGSPIECLLLDIPEELIL